ncbi:ribonuclease D [Thiomicrospira microaerophila]|uniref:ribonuclease D n=1 Tax=Thiomicrospira microaerophila TaxID=406020 RepID=UPI0006971CAA|nr:ribonuclease D [Thiomicrospira microaerophila]
MNYTTITHSDALLKICDHLANQAWLAIDTEFIRKDTYYPILALVQICTAEDELILVDPLPIDDLSPLWQLMANPKICKVFHSARQDIEVLFQLGQTMPQNLFDTQIAGVFLGYGDMAGFARVVEAEFSVILDKSMSRTNWLKRPLSEAQIQYALDDVRYLAPWYRKLQNTLTDEQKQALHDDIQQMLQPSLYTIDPDQAWLKVKGTKGFNAKRLGLVKALAAWREEQAVRQNLPRKWVINDEVIVSLAKRPVKEIESLYKVPGISASIVRQYGKHLIEQLDLAFAHPEYWPKKNNSAPPPTLDELEWLQRAQDFAQQVAQDKGISPHNLYNKAALLALLRQQPNELERGWRKRILSDPLKQHLS